MKIRTVFFLMAAAAMTLSCGNSSNNANRASNSKNGPEVKKGVAPVADPEIAVIEMENGSAYGTIKMELYSNIAPKAVQRFKELAQDGTYDGGTFHRITDAVIQGGDPLSKDNDPKN